ncbi:MAG: DUF2007 domain-containing protein [Nitrospira sp.]|nr:DUF2007 domain-containing protein [Nitrospira sp.]
MQSNWGAFRSTDKTVAGGVGMRMIHLMNAQNVGELAIIKSLLDGNRIAYVIHGEHMSSLYPGVPSFVSRVMVDVSDHARAEVLLSRLRLSIREASA